MNTSSLKPMRPVMIALGVCAAIIALGASGLPQSAAPAGRAAYVWKDVDGNPLPFQEYDAILEFLRTAGIESEKQIDLGVTNPRRVVLDRDGVRAHAALRDYDETFTQARIGDDFYARLRDSFVFDIPAYELALILGLDHVPPVTLRRLGGAPISLQMWLEGGLMEGARVAENIDPPSAVRFRQHQQDMRVFDSLIGNVDRNTGNILWDENWNPWLIDHSRSFMRNDDTRYLERVEACSRWLYGRLKELTFEDIEPRLSPPLTRSEVEWVLRRRDKVIAHLDELIAVRGEGAVLFGDIR